MIQCWKYFEKAPPFTIPIPTGRKKIVSCSSH